MTDVEKALDRTCELALSISDDYLDLLWTEIEKIPDDESITLSAGQLKSLFLTCKALQSYIMNDMDAVEQYLKSKNLI